MKLRKNAYGSSEKKVQATAYHNHKSRNATATKFSIPSQLLVLRKFKVIECLCGDKIPVLNFSSWICEKCNTTWTMRRAVDVQSVKGVNPRQPSVDVAGG